MNDKHSFWCLQVSSEAGPNLFGNYGIRWLIVCEHCGLFWLGSDERSMLIYAHTMVRQCKDPIFDCAKIRRCTRSHRIEWSDLYRSSFPLVPGNLWLEKVSGVCLDCGEKLERISVDDWFSVVMGEGTDSCAARRMKKALG
jgi:hypothetical protein